MFDKYDSEQNEQARLGRAHAADYERELRAARIAELAGVTGEPLVSALDELLPDEQLRGAVRVIVLGVDDPHALACAEAAAAAAAVVASRMALVAELTRLAQGGAHVVDELKRALV